MAQSETAPANENTRDKDFIYMRNTEQDFVALFGTYCRTRAYRLAEDLPYDYLEAYQEAGSSRWCVAKITVKDIHDEEGTKVDEEIRVKTINKGQSFQMAINILTQFENGSQGTEQPSIPAEKTIEELGIQHYIPFAEREGIIFDKMGNPKFRIGDEGLPDGTFRRSDLTRADKNFDPNNVSAKPAESPFKGWGPLSDFFRRAASRGNYQDVIATIQALDDLDKFVAQFRNATQQLQRYTEVYDQLRQGERIDAAVKAFDDCYEPLKAAKKKGFPTEAFENFVEQCKVCCLTIHSKALWDVARRGLDDKAGNIKTSNKKRDEAVKHLKKIGGGNEEVAQLEAYIISASKPEVPESITSFLTNYDTRRAEFKEKLQRGESVSIKAVLPPAP